MYPVLVFTERGVTDIRPTATISDVGIARPGHGRRPGSNRTAFKRLVTAASCRSSNRLGAGSVILQVENQRIFKFSSRLQVRDDSSDSCIHVLDHGTINGHALGLPVFMLDL